MLRKLPKNTANGGFMKRLVKILAAAASVESIEIVNSTIENTEVICSDSETEMRDVISALNSSVANVVPKKEDGTIKAEFVPKLEILDPVDGKKDLGLRYPTGIQMELKLQCSFSTRIKSGCGKKINSHMWEQSLFLAICSGTAHTTMNGLKPERNMLQEFRYRGKVK